jgi:DNA modification methylase
LSIRILTGDCREVMRAMPAESVDCIVTSPPYWGLRSYLPNGHADKPRELGLEPTLGEHIATMVDVFEHARRVLKKTGTLWLNYGSSYAAAANGRSAADTKAAGNDDRTFRDKPFSTVSPGKRSSRFRSDALAYDSDGTALADSRAIDSFCSGLCDECLSDFLSHHGHTSGIGQSPAPSPSPSVQISHGNGHSDSEPAEPPVSPRDVPLSTTLESWRQLRGPCSRCDSRASGLSAVRSSSGDAQESVRSSWLNYSAMRFKPKDLILVPDILALALQQAGWWLRSEIIWQKPNPMPESVRDRPTSSHEKIWLLTKSERYFYDAEAIAEECSSDSHGSPNINPGEKQRALGRLVGKLGKWTADDKLNGRNRRNVWTIPSQPFSEAHFATFPPALVEPCILAGCPEKVCALCGKPWLRQVERSTSFQSGFGRAGRSSEQVNGSGKWAGIQYGANIKLGPTINTTTLGFHPSCHCNAATVPGTVLDPFGGSGTTGMVADRLGRNAILIELNAQYAAMAQSRIVNDLPLFAAVEVSA